ncbi:peptide chain release factor 2 [Oceanivirga miroungae]|uniref:Peptide chain release factor 2 n=1 Tax=Oceanivirga miroungae TaxID=1130046 RepID=A0A6I8MF11_9FUSO|nr:peptide chain release factor 2 [Oceanivirga miroungae]VWL85852.1 peptide chain release factor 2 [Oceanivirga miroungae]
MESFEIKKEVTNIYENLKDKFCVDDKIEKIKQIEKLMLDADFFKRDDNLKIIDELNTLKKYISDVENINLMYNNIEVLLEFIASGDTDSIKDLENTYEEFVEITNEFSNKVLLNGAYDKNNAIVTINSGAGGTEACDWANMLYRMYERYSAKNKFKLEVLDILEGEEAGIKSITLNISGEYAYGLLSCEKGVHRLVRISPFDSNKRRHTSFAAVNVIPEISDDVEINLVMSDLKIDTYRASGAGGQHVNTTDSAVRITHIPTNIVVTCQNERSQLKNKESAMKVLKAKLFELELEKKENEISEIKGEELKNEWGSQIRSYVMQPYKLVKDHRTKYEAANVEKVLDGYIDDFINAFLKFKSLGE